MGPGRGDHRVTFAVLSAGMLAFAHSAEWEMYVSNALMGIGFGMAFPAMSALIVGAVPASQTGVASGMNANIRTIGGSIGSALMASIVTSRLLPSGLPHESGYTTGFAAMTAGLVLAAAAGLLIPAARRAAGPAGDSDAPRRRGGRRGAGDRVAAKSGKSDISSMRGKA